MTIPIYKPYLPKSSLKYAHEALDSGWISSQGKYIQITQEKLQELLNVKYALLLGNGTHACHLMAKSLSQKLNSKRKQIIVPNNVYVAAWNSFLFDKEYELIPIDADLNTWNIDLKQLDLAINKYPSACVLIVHNIGNIINVPSLQKKYPNTIFVEDACEALFGEYEGVYAGTKSLCASISFYGNKVLTSGEGGGLITNDEEIFNYAKCVQGQGQSNQRFIHNKLGYNYRINNIQAAILLGQLEIVPQILEMKIEVFNRYRAALKDRNDIKIQSVSEDTQHSNWMMGIRIPGHIRYSCAETYFKARGIEIRPMFYTIKDHNHLYEHMDIYSCDCTNARILNMECFILPSYPELTADEQRHILKVLEEYVKDMK